MGVIDKLRKAGVRRIFVYAFIFCVQKIRCFFYQYVFSGNGAVLRNVVLNQPAQFSGRGRISLYKVNVGTWSSPSFLSGYAYFEARSPSACIEIGEETFLNNNASIIADRTSVIIGRRCLIGVGFSAVDSDFHGLEVGNRSNGEYECAPVMIGDDVFIGNNVTLLKGVEIGCGSVVGSGSLVVNDVPPFTVYAGVPAKLIRNLPRV